MLCSPLVERATSSGQCVREHCAEWIHVDIYTLDTGDIYTLDTYLHTVETTDIQERVTHATNSEEGRHVTRDSDGVMMPRAQDT